MKTSIAVQLKAQSLLDTVHVLLKGKVVINITQL